MTSIISDALNLVNSVARISFLSVALKNEGMQKIDQIYKARLKLLIDEVGTSAKLSSKVGKSAAQISQWLNGSKDSKTGKPRAISRQTARELEILCDKPEGWMDQPLKTPFEPESFIYVRPAHAEANTENTEPGPDRRADVPLISWIQAGSWQEAEDPFASGDAEKWLPCLASHSPGSYALRVRGDSMTAPHGNMKTYPEGCIVFVDPERKLPANGERIIAKLDGANEVTFKVYKEEDGRRWLMPLNPAHEPIRASFRVLGTVIGKWEDD